MKAPDDPTETGAGPIERGSHCRFPAPPFVAMMERAPAPPAGRSTMPQYAVLIYSDETEVWTPEQEKAVMDGYWA